MAPSWRTLRMCSLSGSPATSTAVSPSALEKKQTNTDNHIKGSFLKRPQVHGLGYRKYSNSSFWHSLTSSTPQFCGSIYLSVCQSLCLLVCPSVGLLVSLSIGLSTCLSICLSFGYLSICLPASLSVGLLISLSACLFVCLSACLTVCLFDYLSVFWYLSFFVTPVSLSICEFTHQSVSPLVWLLSLYMTASVCLSAVCLSFSVNLLIHLVWRDSVFLLVCLSAWPTEAYMPFSVYLFSSQLSISLIASTIFGLSYCQFIRLTYARICMYVRPSVSMSVPFGLLY